MSNLHMNPPSNKSGTHSGAWESQEHQEFLTFETLILSPGISYQWAGVYGAWRTYSLCSAYSGNSTHSMYRTCSPYSACTAYCTVHAGGDGGARPGFTKRADGIPPVDVSRAPASSNRTNYNTNDQFIGFPPLRKAPQQRINNISTRRIPLDGSGEFSNEPKV